MKVRHIRKKPWTRKGPAQKAFRKQSRSIRRRAASAAMAIDEAFTRYLRASAEIQEL